MSVNEDTAVPDTECQLTLDLIASYDDSNLPFPLLLMEHFAK
jgi:hypothetical protein